MDIVVGGIAVTNTPVEGTMENGTTVSMDMVPLTQHGRGKKQAWAERLCRHLGIGQGRRQLSDSPVVREIHGAIHALFGARTKSTKRLNPGGQPVSTFATVRVRGKDILVSTVRPFSVKRDLPTMSSSQPCTDA